jgi:hypothetical protein
LGSTQHLLGTNEFLASLPSDQKERILESAKHPNGITTALNIAGPVIAVLVQIGFNAIVLFAATRTSRSSLAFSRVWAASVNIAVPTVGLGILTAGIVCILRGGSSFDSNTALAQSVPSLATIVASTSSFANGMLAKIDAFSLWGLWLNANALRWMCGLTGPKVWLVPAGITVASAIVAGVQLSQAP